MKSKEWLLTLALLLFQNTVHAENSNELLNDCNQAVQVLNNEWSEHTDFDAAWRCVAFVDGAVNTMSFARGYYNLPGFAGICLPVEEKLSVNQYVRIITKFMRENPETLHQPRIFQVVRSLVESYPCSKN